MLNFFIPFFPNLLTLFIVLFLSWFTLSGFRFNFYWVTISFSQAHHLHTFILFFAPRQSFSKLANNTSGTKYCCFSHLPLCVPMIWPVNTLNHHQYHCPLNLPLPKNLSSQFNVIRFSIAHSGSDRSFHQYLFF